MGPLMTADIRLIRETHVHISRAARGCGCRLSSARPYPSGRGSYAARPKAGRQPALDVFFEMFRRCGSSSRRADACRTRPAVFRRESHSTEQSCAADSPGQGDDRASGFLQTVCDSRRSSVPDGLLLAVTASTHSRDGGHLHWADRKRRAGRLK